MSYKDIVPYTSVFIDASLSDFLKSAYWCIKPPKTYSELIVDLEQIFKNTSNSNSVIPCLSVRSGLDLFLSVHSFPFGSEIIMSAVNIPSMAEVVHSHGLKIVTLDLNIQTMKPKVELLESLISSKTKYLLIANIFGRGYDITPFCNFAKKHNLLLIQDWAEGFSGLDYFGHPDSDLSLFSFGPIKYYTAYGGAIAKVKDVNVYHRMKNLHDSYPIQSHSSYLSKVMKLSIGYMLLNCPQLIKPVFFLLRKFGIDHKEKVIGLLRGFPSEMMRRIRHRPCCALLATLEMRLKGFDPQDFGRSNSKAEYALSNLPPGATAVGLNAESRNHWLFPVLVKNPEKTIVALNRLGVDAYCGATQLNVLKSDKTPWNQRVDAEETKRQLERYTPLPDDSEERGDRQRKIIGLENRKVAPDVSVESRSPPVMSEAEYMMDHIIYLPINKIVPFGEIDKICRALAKALAHDQRGSDDFKLRKESNPAAVKSKL